MEQPCVTIVIVHYKGLKKLENCLRSVFNSNYTNIQVILVDNGSNDNSIDAVKKIYGHKMNVIRSETNQGFIGGNNLALAKVSTKYVVLLNDDTEVDPNWLDYILDVVEADSTVGACQPKLLSLKNPKYFEYNGAAGGFLDIYGVPFTRGRIFDLEEKDEGQYDTNIECFWASGAAMFLRTKALIEAGFLDSLLYVHMEEIDLSWRLRLHGYKVVAIPKSVVYHLGGGTALEGVIYYKQRNNLVMMLKNFSSLSLLRYFPFRVILDWVSFLYFLRDESRSISILKAYYWVLKHLKEILIRRYRVQTSRKISDMQILKKMMKKSVAIQYYILGRKRFNQIVGLPENKISLEKTTIENW